MNPRKSEFGFSIAEISVALVILTLLACMAVPAVTAIRGEAQVDQIVELARRTSSACKRYHQDTGLYGKESGDDGAANWSQFSDSQSIKGWQGPYLDQPLDLEDNPFRGNAIIYSTFNGGNHKLYANQFCLTGPSGRPIRGKGNFLVLESVPQEIAEAVDAVMDHEVSGNWKRYGRVQWKPSLRGTLMIYLLGGH